MQFSKYTYFISEKLLQKMDKCAILFARGDIMKCPNCGAPRNANDRFCNYCRMSFDNVPAGMNAPAPGAPVATGNPQGPVVHVHVHQGNMNGQPVMQNGYFQQPIQSDRNRMVALLLCLFLGVLGGHKFYLGHTGMGVVYLLTCGFCGIGCLIDLIVLLIGMPVDARGFVVKWK